MSVALMVVAICGVVVAILVLLLARRWRRRADELEARVRRLEPFQAVGDVTAFVATQQEVVRQAVAQATAEAERLRDEAKADASLDRKQARELTAKAQQALERAHERGKVIIGDAERQAKVVAGEALDAIRDAKRLEQTVRALENVIDGYGDKYLVPTHDLLDDLADAYSFAEAGTQLKQVRSQIREMVVYGRAAQCDYVEDGRRRTAINFVTDAFNGKVASILAELTDENYGTLSQQIRDAAALVNANGKAFKDARITPAYLDLRLEELRWAVAGRALRERDREGRRVPKERMREEAKAQREAEKALRESQKEEEVLRKAMEKAQQQIDKASIDQKATYEAQLQDLVARLALAEEKGKRAISMAQQTKSGHVYVISNVGSFGENVFKIGMTRRLVPMDRIKELGDASVPFDFDVHALIPSDDAPALENSLHRQFVRRQVNKVNARKEFFRVGLQDIRTAIEKAGGQASWTMAAECRQYRETQVLERALETGTADEKAWIERQIHEHEAASDVDAEDMSA